eukprot:TRINITY_DN1836_c0_g1_i3.p1 TRINITY_DN1836_c0_g1~~TRINITY_DN1836_c0_g1_i3.p1  ORF type:complete len:526 (+),score=108.37 TRINITY_DN1836_c0_g1_i3:99-1676(+)
MSKRSNDHEPDQHRKKRRTEEDKGHNYSDVKNPFHDENLSSSFDWKLKREKDKKEGRNDDQDYDQTDAQRELNKLIKRREERDRQQKQKEEERARQSRLKEQSSYAELAKREDEFHLKQARIRAMTRLKENRSKAIDHFYLINILTISDPTNRHNLGINSIQDLPINTVIKSPSKVLKFSTKQDTEELLQDIKMFLELDTEAIEYWKSVSKISENHLNEISQNLSDDDGAVHSALIEEIDKTMEGKSLEELKELEDQIQTQLSDMGGADHEYWLSLLKRLSVKIALKKIDELHRKVVQDRIKLLQKAGKNSEEIQIFERKMCDIDYVDEPQTSNDGEDFSSSSSSYSSNSSSEQRGKRTVIKTRLTEEEMMELELSKGFEEDEEQFSLEYTISDADQPPSKPGEKKRTKKPKYFNRVKMGYDWNKYNQVHYDLDSPPPKVVQGYQFNIFYPDLTESKVTPHYKLLKTDNPDLVILLFQASPPYKDVAFKIVNSEWESSQKAGFKCQFSNGILHLWFSFKKYRYRR